MGAVGPRREGPQFPCSHCKVVAATASPSSPFPFQTALLAPLLPDSVPPFLALLLLTLIITLILLLPLLCLPPLPSPEHYQGAEEGGVTV